MQSGLKITKKAKNKTNKNNFNFISTFFFLQSNQYYSKHLRSDFSCIIVGYVVKITFSSCCFVKMLRCPNRSVN